MPGCHVHWLLEELSSETSLSSWKISSWFSFAGENVEKLAYVGHIWMIVTVGLFSHCSLSRGTCRFYCIWSLVGTAADGVQLVFVISHLYAEARHCALRHARTIPEKPQMTLSRSFFKIFPFSLPIFHFPKLSEWEGSIGFVSLGSTVWNRWKKKVVEL